MTATVDINSNNRVRKTLASQLDRLDQILDGLADGLNQAVASAVREAVGQAVERAVTGVLTEILTNPAFVDRLRGAVPAPVPEKGPPVEPVPCPPRRVGPLQRARGWLQAGWSRARQAVGSVFRRATTATVRTCAFVRNTVRRAGVITLTMAAAVGAGVGYLAGPHVMAFLSGAAAWLAARGSQGMGWLQRRCAWGLSG
jgi:hypothetical protein